MKNGIIKNGKAFKAVYCLNTGIVPVDNCARCDFRKICKKSDCEYPCTIFGKEGYSVHFRRVFE